MSDTQEIVQRLEREMADRAAAVEKVDAFKNQLARAIKASWSPLPKGCLTVPEKVIHLRER